MPQCIFYGGVIFVVTGQVVIFEGIALMVRDGRGLRRSEQHSRFALVRNCNATTEFWTIKFAVESYRTELIEKVTL